MAAVTRTAEYFKVMDELTKVNPKSPSDNDSYLKAVKHMVEVQMRHLGHALRYHNEQNPSNQIILQDVMKDVIAFETNQPRGRSAAQNHFLCLLALGTTVERHKTSARGDGNLAKIAILSEIQFSIVKAFDIPLGILIGQGYNVSIADEGARYTEKERRHACHSSLKDFTTTMTETQGGTGGDMHNFDNWDVPLTFNDGRLPNEVDFWNNEEPSWIHDDTSTGPSAPEYVLSSGGTTTTGIATTTRFDHSAEKDAEIINWRRCIFVDSCQLSDLDQVRHLKIKPNQREVKIGLQLKTG